MKYLVTGCAGFIAARTTELLLEEGHSVVGIDNMNDYYDVSLKEHRLDALKKHEKFEFHLLDIENFEDLKPIFEKQQFDCVFNLAARAGVRYSMIDPFVYMRTNATGTLNLLECMKEHSVKKMVLASTSSLYAGQEMPFIETLPVNTPISPYAAAKKAAEVMAYTYHDLYDLDISIVRYFTVYGPCARPDMAPLRFMKWIDDGTPIELFGDGSQSRDFTYVDDIARGTILAQKELGYEIINLGGGNNPITISQFIEWTEEYLGKKAKINQKPFQKVDMMATWANIDKAKKLLNWEPKIEVKEGIKLSVDWYEKNRAWLKDLKL